MVTLRVALAEAIGTFILVLGGCGTAVLATGAFTEGGVGTLGVAFAFGLSLLVAAYAIGNVTGCHINPAVTLAMWLSGRTSGGEVPAYFGGQVVGGIIGGGAIWLVANGGPDDFSAEPANFAVNGWGDLSPGGFSFTAMAVTEIVLTAVFVFIVLSTVRRGFPVAAGGLAAGMALALVHLVSIPVDNTSVNPARSLAVAVYAGSDALEQVWAFIVFPLIGAVVGFGAWMALNLDADSTP
jgi:aquaporin Z